MKWFWLAPFKKKVSTLKSGNRFRSTWGDRFEVGFRADLVVEHKAIVETQVNR